MFNLILIIKTAGYLGIFGIIFIETGVFFGFFFPGDTLLFSVGVLAFQNYFSLPVVVVVLSLASITGGFFGYWTGQKIGPRLFAREDSLFFKKSHVVRATQFFTKHGNKTIFLSRYVPIVRTFAPTVAGVASMNFRNFIINNILGGVAWCTSITLLGYYIGQKIPNIDAYLLPTVACVCLASFFPILIEVFKRKNIQKTRQNQKSDI